MRALSLSLVLVFILSGVSVAGSTDNNGVPHAGLFQMHISQRLVVASR